MRTILVAGLLVAVGFLPTGISLGEGCTVSTSPTTLFINGFYVTTHIWKETNSLPGLQIRDSGCNDGTWIPADTCIYVGPGLPTVGCLLNLEP